MESMTAEAEARPSNEAGSGSAPGADLPPLDRYDLEIVYRDPRELKDSARNAKLHPPEQLEAIARLMDRIGWANPVLHDEHDEIIAGHGRKAAALLRGRSRVPAVLLRGLSEDEKRALRVADNKLSETGWDSEKLAAELQHLQAASWDAQLLGFSEADLAGMFGGAPEPAAGKNAGSLAAQFMVPPFSVLSAREGWWQERKRAWLSLGIQSEVGRAGNLLGYSLQSKLASIIPGSYSAAAGFIEKHRAAGLSDLDIEQRARAEHGFTEDAAAYEGGNSFAGAGTSIFDPVLAELAYRWFSPPNGAVLDPFAGGSVRGIVAQRLGRRYVGVDLRLEQVEANGAQARKICSGEPPVWIVGDSRQLREALARGGAWEPFDFLFSCPPYGDLERYSDDPADLSAMDHAAFCAAYRQAIAAAAESLRPDRFACFVVGDFRDGAGFYRNFVGETVAAFEAAGLRLYNEAILVTAAGSLPIRAAKMFSSARKLGKTHQNILVFVKGDPRKATEACGQVVVDEALAAAIEAARDPEEDDDGDVPAAPPPQPKPAPRRELEPAEAEAEAQITDPEALTPVQQRGELWLKRDDLYALGAATGCKARTMTKLLAGASGVIGYGSRKSTMISRVAQVAQHVGLPCRIHTATGETLTEMQEALDAGAELVQHAPGYIGVLAARAREDAKARGWALIPWGMECPEAIEEGRKQVANIPADIKRLVLPVGSGVALSAILWGLLDAGRLGDFPILGVRIHADPFERIDRLAPPGWRMHVQIVEAGVPFEKEVAADVDGVRLDPIYEAKCARFLEPGDLLWIVGIRRSARGRLLLEPAEAPAPSPESAALAQLAAETQQQIARAFGGHGETRDPLERFEIPRAEGGPAWAKRRDGAALKRVAELYKRHDAGFTLGAFTAAKENAIAEWDAAGSLDVRQREGRLVCAGVFSSPARPQPIRDFAERLLATMKPGDLQIRRLAGDAAALEQLLEQRIAAAELSAERAGRKAACWLELWQERAEDRALAERCGFRWIGSKIRASSEIVGVWLRGESGAEPTPAAEQAALVRLQLPELDVAPLAARLAAGPLAWADHYSSYNKGHTWSALALRGYGGDPAFIIKPSEMSKAWKAEHPAELTFGLRDTALREQLPEAEPLIAAIPGAKHRIRLMRLAPGGGELTRHADITDPDAGVAPGRLLRIHIPLITNPGVRFEQWLLDGSRREAHMRAGEAWYLDTRKPHTATNRGATERVHLVLDVESSQALLELLPQ
jgi:hypothetical protein